MAIGPRLRGRPAHTPGPTFLNYTPNGRKLITVGLNNAMRIFETGSDAEPITIDDVQDAHTAIAAANGFFVVGSEDGTVCKYSLETNSLDGLLVRSTLPIRDIALSPDGIWAAVASDELVVKIVNTHDMERVMYLREQPKPAKHVSFDPSGSYIAVSCTDGVVYVYSLSSEEPELIKKVHGLIRALESDAEACSRVVWHPDGRAFAAPTATRDIQVMSRSDWERQRTFSSGHSSEITALAWSLNGALLATASADRNIVLWDTKTQTIIKRFDQTSIRATILDMQWHPTENLLSYTNNDGELYLHTDIVPPEHASLLEMALQGAPLIHDPLKETPGNAGRMVASGLMRSGDNSRKRFGTPDSLDEILGNDGNSEGGLDFIEDDDGAGYVEEANGNGKRTSGHLGNGMAPPPKRPNYNNDWRSPIHMHESFQPGSTPWRGNRRYLCLNLTGFVWTVDQNTHHTITVEFYDRDRFRDFHFTDPFLYDKASLNQHGTLFSCPASDQHPCTIYYRPHETWTTRVDWRVELPAEEEATSIALSSSYVVATTSKGYVRVYSLFGVPLQIFRQKSSPAIACAAWRDYVLTIGNGPLKADRRTCLQYSIENVKRDQICQDCDTIPLVSDANLVNVFFSDSGDPCIFDTDGVLLVLQHWRTMGQAKWVPLLDTNQMARLQSGRKKELYWPVAVARDKFHCIILKGGETEPYFPRPLLSEFDFHVPIATLAPSTDDEEEAQVGTEVQRLEESFVRKELLLTLMTDLVHSTNATHAQTMELARAEVEVDKTLLQLIAAECREGEERGMKALEIVGLMKDRTGRMLEAASKIATRFQRDVLREKIDALAERRLVGLEEVEET
ncbi:DNA polymerase alpha accessory factor Mcl1 [Elasticomyces elasticus]|nr:DNA polymerase alpha accessory factor Mcl1 [Elasticomyces elasticus]